MPKRGIPLLAVLVVVTAVAFLNLDGYHLGPPGLAASGIGGEPPIINWTHGWPCDFLVRSSVRQAMSVIQWMEMDRKGTGITNRWPFDSAPVNYYHLDALIADIVVLIFLAVGTYFSIRTLAASRELRIQFSLKAMLLAMSIVAAVLLSEAWTYAPRQLPEYFAYSIVATAAVISLATAGSSIWCFLHALNRTASK